MTDMDSDSAEKAQVLLQIFDEEEGSELYAVKLIEILQKIPPLRSKLEGFALMAIMEIGEVFLPSGETLEEPTKFIPNLQMIASVPAVYLDHINNDPYWWRFKYLAWDNKSEMETSITSLINLLKSGHAVSSVAGFDF